MRKLFINLFRKNKMDGSPGVPIHAEQKSGAATVPSIVVLIDAENVSPFNISAYIKDISKEGTITCIEAVGNGKLLESKNWKNILLLHHVKPCMTLNVKKGKDVADSQIQLRAMELFYEQKQDMTYIISHDSDFSSLVQMLRSKNHPITIVLRQDVPLSYLFSTGNIIYEEVIPGLQSGQPLRNLPVKKHRHTKVIVPVPLSPSAITAALTAEVAKQEVVLIRAVTTSKPTTLVSKPGFPIPGRALINRAYKNTPKGRDGSVSAGPFNKCILKFDPDFTVKKYGFNTFKKFMYSLEPDYKVICAENGGLYIQKSSSTPSSFVSPPSLLTPFIK